MNYDNSRVTSIISRIGNYLREELPEDDVEGERHLAALEALCFELLEVTVDWKCLLAEKKSQYLHPKDSAMTELDRKVSLNASVATIKRDVDFLTGLQTLVTQRIELAKSIY